MAIIPSLTLMSHTPLKDNGKDVIVTAILQVLADHHIIYDAVGNAVTKTSLKLFKLAQAAKSNAAAQQAFITARAEYVGDDSARDGRYAKYLRLCDSVAGGGAVGAAGGGGGGGGSSSSAGAAR